MNACNIYVIDLLFMFSYFRSRPRYMVCQFRLLSGISVRGNMEYLLCRPFLLVAACDVSAVLVLPLSDFLFA
jgi:uncharacterized membrane protein